MTSSKSTKKGNTSLPTSQEKLQALMLLEKGAYKYSVEDFFKKPQKTYFRLSPDGSHFAFLGIFERRQNLFVQAIGQDEATRITAETDRDIAGFIWANDNRLLYIKDDGGDENFKLYAVNKDGSKAKDLTPFEEVRIQIIDALPEHDNEVIIGMNKNNPQLFEPYRLDINSGKLEQLAQNDNPLEPFSAWMTDHEGKLRLATRIRDGVNSLLLYRPDEAADWKVAIENDWKNALEPLFFDFENKNQIYASSNLGRDKATIVKFDLSTGKEVEVLYQHDQVDVDGLSYSKKRKVLTTISYTTDKRNLHFLDESVAKIYKDLREKLGDYEIVISSTNKAEDKFIVRTYSDRSLGAYYFYDLNEKKITKICELSPWLDEADMAAMKPITYTTRDGLTLNGYLTLPQGKDAQQLPVVILPHGGPWARDSWGYNPALQLLASRGYAVLQMNFRGSTGYGKAFWKKSFKKWGQEMQNDITDGVTWLVDSGVADKNRIAIYGGSYGGYAVLAGLTYTPDTYACGIDYVGVSNMHTLLENMPPYWEPYRQMMYEMVGDPSNEADSLMMTQYSPALNADKIKAPLLVVQGANDPRVKILESDQMVVALRERGVEVPYMVKYNEGHGFQNEENKFEFYKVMLGFLAKHLKDS